MEVSKLYPAIELPFFKLLQLLGADSRSPLLIFFSCGNLLQIQDVLLALEDLGQECLLQLGLHTLHGFLDPPFLHFLIMPCLPPSLG